MTTVLHRFSCVVINSTTSTCMYAAAECCVFDTMYTSLYVEVMSFWLFDHTTLC